MAAVCEPGDLLGMLALERVERDIFRAKQVAPQDRPLFGGQVAAQALAAAGATVPAERTPHSLHGYFLRPGNSNRVTEFRVERDRDGRSFSARRVVAIQDGQVIFNMAGSFHQAQAGPEAQVIAMPQVALPLDLPLYVFARQPAFDVRVAGYGPEPARYPTRFWARHREPLPAGVLLHACVLTYLSDASTGLGDHLGRHWRAAASVDHALWLHRPIAFDDWVLVDLVGHVLSAGRGLYTGSVFSMDGTLAATIAQEMIFRRADAALRARVNLPGSSGMRIDAGDERCSAPSHRCRPAELMSSGDHEVSVGLRLPHELQHDAVAMKQFVASAEQAGLDRLCVGDHVTFKGGQGFDGLQIATGAAVLSTRMGVQTAVYLLPLRHPVVVARQLVTLAALAPGRFIFGVGVGGEDPAEFRACGVDPSSRGGRTDESLGIVRRLLAGDAVTLRGRFFELESVQVLPAPTNVPPIVVGGRSTAALRRAARLGDGWLGVWISPDRFAQACRDIAAQADAAGRERAQWQHGLQVWCGFGRDRDRAGALLSQQMTALYQMPFGKFARYSPYGTAPDIAAALRPYLRAGCRSFNLIAVAEDAQQTIEAASAVRALLREATP